MKTLAKKNRIGKKALMGTILVILILILIYYAWQFAEKYAEVHGIVKDAQNGAFVAEVRVDVVLNNQTIASAETDINGYYSIPKIPVGIYMMNFTKTVYNPYSVQVTLEQGQNEVNAEIISFIVTPPGPPIVPPGGKGGISGTITDITTGQPINKAKVQLFSYNILVAETLTNNQGTYLISNLDAGTYNVIVSKSGYVSDTDQIIIGAAVYLIYDVALIPGSFG